MMKPLLIMLAGALGALVGALLLHAAAHASCQATDCHSDHNTEVCRCL